MITKTIYKCELCGSTYETEQDAQKCENYHQNADFITNSKFIPGGKYPTSLIITMANGHKIEYDYVKPVFVEPSDDPYFTNVNVNKQGNVITLTALGERLPEDETYTWVFMFDETRAELVSTGTSVTLTTPLVRLYNIAELVKVKVSAPSVDPAQFVIKEE